MPASQPAARLNCPNCRFTARYGAGFAGMTCPRCRARGRRIEMLVIESLRVDGARDPRL